MFKPGDKVTRYKGFNSSLLELTPFGKVFIVKTQMHGIFGNQILILEGFDQFFNADCFKKIYGYKKINKGVF